MTWKQCRQFYKYMTAKERVYFATEGLNLVLNGMRPEDAEAHIEAFKKRRKRVLAKKRKSRNQDHGKFYHPAHPQYCPQGPHIPADGGL